MNHRSLAAALADLRRCAASRRRAGRLTDAAALLARVLSASRTLAIEERHGVVVVRLQVEDDPALRLTCALHPGSPIPLTAAEAAVAESLCQGRTRAQIAVLRGVSVNTIKSQVRQIFRKLDVDSRVALARRLGL